MDNLGDKLTWILLMLDFFSTTLLAGEHKEFLLLFILWGANLS